MSVTGDSVQQELAEALGLLNPTSSATPPKDPAPVEPPTEEDDGENLSAEDSESEDESEDDSKEDTENKAESVEEAEVQDLRDLAEALEVEPSFLYQLKVPMGDGIESITLGELKDKYQNFQHVDKQSEELKQARAQEARAMAEREQLFQHNVAVLDGILTDMRGKLDQEYKSIDWKNLRDSDPAEFAAKQQEMMLKQSEIQGIAQRAVQAVQTRQQQMLQFQQQQVAENYQKLVGMLPEWRDSKLAEAESASIRQFMTESYGFNPQELAGITDHRVALALRDLWHLKTAQQKIPDAKARVKKFPKMSLKGAGKPADPNQAGKLQVKKLVDRAKATKSKQDIFAAQKALLTPLL